MHTLRKSKSFDCPTCGAVSHKPCRMATPLNEVGIHNAARNRLNNDMLPPSVKQATRDQDGAAEAYHLEFTILRDIRRLTKLKPEHELVRVVGAYYKYQASIITVEDHHFVPFKISDDLLGSCSILGCDRTDSH